MYINIISHHVTLHSHLYSSINFIYFIAHTQHWTKSFSNNLKCTSENIYSNIHFSNSPPFSIYNIFRIVFPSNPPRILRGANFKSVGIIRIMSESPDLEYGPINWIRAHSSRPSQRTILAVHLAANLPGCVLSSCPVCIEDLRRWPPMRFGYRCVLGYRSVVSEGLCLNCDVRFCVGESWVVGGCVLTGEFDFCVFFFIGGFRVQPISMEEIKFGWFLCSAVENGDRGFFYVICDVWNIFQ